MSNILKVITLALLMFVSVSTFAHGSSHPDKCKYERIRYDLVGHCQNYSGSQTWMTFDKDWYTTENMAKRIDEREKEQWITTHIYLPIFITVMLAFFGLVIYGISGLED